MHGFPRPPPASISQMDLSEIPAQHTPAHCAESHQAFWLRGDCETADYRCPMAGKLPDLAEYCKIKRYSVALMSVWCMESACLYA